MRLFLLFLFLLLVSASLSVEHGRRSSRGRKHHRKVPRAKQSDYLIGSLDRFFNRKSDHRRAHHLFESSPRRGLQDGTDYSPLDLFSLERDDWWSKAFSPFDHKELELDAPWWQGGNVCRSVVRDTQDDETSEEENHRRIGFLWMQSKSCTDNGHSYTCQLVNVKNGEKTTETETYECCHGYQRSTNLGEVGCLEAPPMESLMETVQELNGSRMGAMMYEFGLVDSMADGNFTIFLPIDEAFEDSRPLDILDNVIVINPAPTDGFKDDVKSFVAGHLVKGWQKTYNLADNDILPTEHAESTIRFNHYQYFSEEALTANCVPLRVTNRIATNGIVHVIEDVLKPVEANLVDLIGSEERPELSIFNKIMKNSHLRDLAEGDSYTVFAPTNEAFDHPSLIHLIQKAIEENDKEVIDLIVKSHILRKSVCSAGVRILNGKRTVAGNRLLFSSTADDVLIVNGAEVLEADVMALDGVLHVVNKLLIPEEYVEDLKMREQKKVTLMEQYLESSGICDELRDRKNLTLFLPTNGAFANLDNKTKALLNDTRQLREVLMHHLTERKSSYESHKASFTPINSKYNIQVDAHRQCKVPGLHKDHNGPVITAQCVPLEEKNLEMCGQKAHSVSRVLVPPTQSTMEILAADSRYSKTYEMINRAADLADKLSKGTYTILAPDNEAWEKIGETVDDIMNDNNRLQSVLEAHIIEGSMCCSAMKECIKRKCTLNKTTPLTFIFQHGDVGLHTSLRFNTRVTECDKIATNGIVHTLNAPSSISGDRLIDIGSTLWTMQKFIRDTNLPESIHDAIMKH